MNFNQFVVRNTLRNKHLYLAYFLSTMFSVMIFFTFSVFAFHPILADGLNQQAQTGMMVAAVIIYGFAFFFVMYSMGVFLQSRKKEFGLLMIQGMSPLQLRKMVFIENLVIGFFATIGGILIGLGFSQLILMLSKQMIGIEFAFYFPVKAIGITAVAFMVLFLLISFFIQFSLPKLNVQSLLKAGELGKGSFKASLWRSVAALILIGGGYGAALWAQGTTVFMVFIPVVFVVIVGTKFLFDQLSVFVIQRLRKREHIFWKKTNMVVFSDLAFRMKDNARSFFLVAIISTVAFAAIGTLYGFQDMLVGSLDRTPYEFSLSDGKPEQVKAVDDQLTNAKIAYEKVDYRYGTTAEYSFITEADFNRLAKATGEQTVSLGKLQAVQILTEGGGIDSNSRQSAVTIDNTAYEVTDTVTNHTLVTGMQLYVIPDETKVPDSSQYETVIWLTPDASEEKLITLGDELTKANRGMIAKSATRHEIIGMYAPILFVGIFIGIVFFVSAGSFLYFRLYSDMDQDIEKFQMIHKLGLAKKELRKMIYQQIGILFFTPIIVSLCHGAVALTAMYHMFNMKMQLAGWQVLGIFLVIQIVYYLIARSFYFRKVYKTLVAS
ncbi:ABC transporter permease [Candidatus Enterococcus leclercqii]|uniref:ABC transporter permease n=1 Tax=Candidatus Enterococcus leclercqii TaxID=1857218 RepID=UPI00137B3C3C|nr:ABC transporter permease [Enterococcus sp. CU9D]KAF1292657.1 peptide ABC transporter permease [Enterococcus sp. CU9D]